MLIQLIYYEIASFLAMTKRFIGIIEGSKISKIFPAFGGIEA
jgi:hypothetical protein